MNTTSPQNPENSSSDPLPWGHGPYSTKRFGTSLTNCDSEPVQSPGCIQSHGALITCRLADLCILQVSENSAQFLGLAPGELLSQPLTTLLAPGHLQTLQRMLIDEGLEANPLYAFSVAASSNASALDVCVHTMADVLYLEFEATGRSESPAIHPQGDFFTLVRAAVRRMQRSTGLLPFCQQIATEVRAITGLDRVMVYRFHADNHGEVVAESMQDGLDPWLGLHYPEADIPQPARDIYKRIWIRPVPHAAGPVVEMVPLANPDTGQPLTMTHCALRGASIMYTEYLANLGVGASLTMPILIEGVLWGLIACHHKTSTVFPHQLRAACEVLAQVASLQLKSTDHIEQLAYQLKVETVHQQLVSKAAKEGDLLALSDRQPSLLDAMDAEGAALYHMDRWWLAGKTPDEAQLSALAEWVNLRPEMGSHTRPVFETDRLPSLYPDGAAIAPVASGLIAVQVSRVRQDLIMWFRPEIRQTVKWAGNPNDKPLVPGPHGMRLTPRRSFELFIESIHERSLPWSSMEVDSALRLRLLVMDLAVSANLGLEALNIDLTSSNEELDSFAYVASHDLKEPLRGIHRYAHQMLESTQPISSDNRNRMDALMRLVLRMDSLLDSLMHFSRVGRTNLEFEQVDLNKVVADALEMVGVRANDHLCTVGFTRPLPTALCDMVRVREIFTNLISNALKYNRNAKPHIEIGFIRPDESGRLAKMPPEAHAETVYFLRDDGIGIEERHFEQIFRMFKRLHGQQDFGGGVGAGLTVVKKVVKRHGGTVWLESTLGEGSTFYFTLPCATPSNRADPLRSTGNDLPAAVWPNLS
ncbi:MULTISPECIES: ATP-binding protein [unclassified Variovorax]|uniref:ATP-binding protein n=1 Tax=unclassified Variovorax TaxID=663243 RepID=UPI002B22ABF5|nr:ATP-binding protein [Variovorax sp. LG9.2]MEB0060291.1 ATP-binding protein [Variovorax sp. LG9.2]